MRHVLRKITPFVEIKSVERTVIPIQNDLGMALKQQRECPSGSADVDRLPQPVQHKHMLVQRDIHGLSLNQLNKNAGMGQSPAMNGSGLLS
jgi:hypothetical protein